MLFEHGIGQSPLVATNDLARQLPRAALALARTIPLGLVILFDELPKLRKGLLLPLPIFVGDLTGLVCRCEKSSVPAITQSSSANELS